MTGLGGVGKTAIAATIATGFHETGRSLAYLDLSTDQGKLAALTQLENFIGSPAIDSSTHDKSETVPVCILDNADDFDEAFESKLQSLSHGRKIILLLTRRRALGWTSERVIRVDPLIYGEKPDGPSPAATLLLQSMEPGINPGIHETEALCALLEGLPLALLLAARRTRFMTFDRLASSVTALGFVSVMGSLSCNHPGSLGGLSSIVGESVSSLKPGSISVLECCADLLGWTTFELLESALVANGPRLLNGLEELCDSGLVEVGPLDTYRLRRVAREHVLARRTTNELDPFVAEAVLGHVAAIVPKLFGATAATALQRLSLDHEPIIGILASSVRNGQPATAVALAFSLGRYWLLSGQLTEGREWINRVGALASVTEADRIRLLILGATFGSYINESGCEMRLHELLNEASTIGVAIDRIIVNGWCALAAMEAHQNHHVLAASHAKTAADLALGSQDSSLIALARDLAGHVAAHGGDHDRALALALEGIDEARRNGDAYDLLNLLTGAVDSLVRLDRIPEALALSQEAFEQATAFMPGPMVSAVLLLRADALTADGQIHEARGYLAEVLRISMESHPDPLGTADALYILAAGAAREMRDLVAARLFEAARSFLTDCGLELESRMAVHCSREYEGLSLRLGKDRIATLGIVGRSDPQKVVHSVVSGSIWSIVAGLKPSHGHAGLPHIWEPST